MIPSIASLAEQLRSLGQEHVLAFTPSSVVDLEHRLAPLRDQPLSALVEVVRRHLDPSAPAPTALHPQPPDVVASAGVSGIRDAAALDAGRSALAAGRVGLVTVAGGMGTRLGWRGPKGTYPVGPVSQRTLFELFAQKIRAVGRRHGALPCWGIQTSDANDSETRRFFETNDYFELPRAMVCIFPQGNVPAFDSHGRLVLTQDGDIAMLPDGHGGIFRALHHTGTLDWFQAHGADLLSYFQVDNPLVNVADPEFLGHHILRSSDMSTKVVAKSTPDERVGVLALISGKLHVIEYTELAPHLATQRNADGRLVLDAGNTGIHIIGVPFARQVASEGHLTAHVAAKRIPVGPAVEPESATVDGLKLEYFVFDALPLARATLVFEVARHIEFAPIKAETGDHSPAAARIALSRETRALAVEAGIDLGDIPAEKMVEHDYSQIADAQDLRLHGRAAILGPVDMTA